MPASRDERRRRADEHDCTALILTIPGRIPSPQPERARETSKGSDVHQSFDEAFARLATGKRSARIGNKAKLWTLRLGRDGQLEEVVEPQFTARLEDNDLATDAIIDALIDASAEQHIAETRIW
jgi:hypothetical protein